MKTLTFMLALMVAAMVAGCSGSKCEGESCEAIPLETSNAALSAGENVKQNLEDLGDMLAFLEDSKLMLDAFGMFGDTQKVCAPVPAGEEGEPECWDESTEVEVDTDMKEVAEEIADWLNENVFTDSQLESDGNSLVYLLDPVTFCAMDGEDGNDEECQDILTKIPIRVKVTSYSEGDLDIDILVGEAELDPIDIRLYSNMLGLAVDLAATRDVAQLYFDTFGEEGENPELPTTFEGIVSLSLERLNNDQFKLTYEVEKTIKLGMTVEGDEFDLSLGKSIVSMVADQAAKTVSMDADIGALDVVIPYQLFIDAMWDSGEESGEGYAEVPDEKPPVPEPYDDIIDEETPSVTGTAALHIAGFSGAATFSADSDSLTITGLGLGGGPTTFKRDSETLVSINLNQGGTFDLDVAADGEDVVVTVTPKFDLSVMMALATIADDLNELPGFMAADTLTATLDGAAAPALRILDAVDGIQVAEGQLTLSSLAFPADTVTVAGGQCLFAEEDESDSPAGDDEDGEQDPLPEEGNDGHELLSMLYADSCQ